MLSISQEEVSALPALIMSKASSPEKSSHIRSSGKVESTLHFPGSARHPTEYNPVSFPSRKQVGDLLLLVLFCGRKCSHINYRFSLIRWESRHSQWLNNAAGWVLFMQLATTVIPKANFYPQSVFFFLTRCEGVDYPQVMSIQREGHKGPHNWLLSSFWGGKNESYWICKFSSIFWFFNYRTEFLKKSTFL